MKQLLGMIICSLWLATAAAAQEPPEVQEVLDYWFGPLPTAEVYPHEDKAHQWFTGGYAIDQEIRNRFEKLVVAATKDELANWKETPRGRLALIILLDQFTRNIYRGTPEAFASDPIAQELTLEGLLLGDDQALFPIQRVFFYFPLEHAENLQLQKLSVEKFHDILPDVPEEQFNHFIDFENYAQRHYETIARFGRFPHRNVILNRESTPEEIEFLGKR